VAALLPTGAQAAAPGPGDITTVAGGPGYGPATDLGQDVVAAAYTPSHIWVIDRGTLAGAYVLRVVDRATGLESAPVRVYPQPPGRHPDAPSLAAESNGDVLVAYNADTGGYVEEVTPSGGVRRVAGGGPAELMGVDGLKATQERLGVLNGIAVTSSGVVYLSENGYNDGTRDVSVTGSMIRRIGAGGRLTTVAGALGPGYLGDGGPALAAELNQPMDLALDPAGNLYVADFRNSAVRRITPLGLISTVVSVPVGGLAWFAGALHVADVGRCVVARWDGTRLVTVAGVGTCGWTGDGGPALAAKADPVGLAADGQALSFVQRPWSSAAFDAAALRTIEPDGTVARTVGSGFELHSGDGGSALAAELHFDGVLATDPAGDVYLTDRHWLRKVDPSGTITTVAGDGRTGPVGGDGAPATATTFQNVDAVAVAPDGQVYLADSSQARIYRIDPSGTLRLVAGTGVAGLSGDGGPATAGQVRTVSGLAFAPSGDLYFLDGCTLRRVDTAGVLTTVAGDVVSGGRCGTTPDGVTALGAPLGWADDLTVDPAGRVLFVEAFSGSYRTRVRAIGLDGRFVTLAGGGTQTPEGVQATDAALPQGSLSIVTDAAGRLLIADRQGGRVLRVGTDGLIGTVVGGGTGPDGGPALGALVASPSDLAFTSSGDLLLFCRDARTGLGGGVLRKVTQL
jgi:hypothetical protein